MLANPQIFFQTLVVTCIASLFTIYLSFRRRGAPGAIYLTILMVAILIWVLGFILELYAGTLQLKFLGLQIQYILGISFASSLWLLSAINFVSGGKHPTRNEFILLSAIPAATMILMITTNLHHLFYYNFRIVSISSYKFLFKDEGPWFYVHIAYSYAALAIGTILLLVHLKKSKNIYRAQTAYILIGVLLPWIASIAYVAGMKSFMPLDFTPTSFTFSVALIGWANYRHGLFEIIPAARDVVVESMRNGVLILDGMKRIVDFNPAALRIFKKDIIPGTHINDLLKDFNLTYEDLKKNHDSKKEVHLNEDIFDLLIAEVFLGKTATGGEILNFFNITGIKKNEKALSELNATKDKFFSIIAHDLKNPFYGIMGLSEILASEEDVDSDEIKIISKEIKELATNTYRMLENLLDWSRSQTGILEYLPQDIDLNEILEENLSHLNRFAALKKIKIISGIENNLIAFADKNMINTIFRNLISNAVKFTPAEGTIRIQNEPAPDSIVISIADNGVGMNEKTLEQIFRIDKTVNSVGTAGEKGTGLGLLLCKEFIEKNGGKIWVESKPGIGTTFYFSLTPGKP